LYVSVDIVVANMKVPPGQFSNIQREQRSQKTKWFALWMTKVSFIITQDSWS